MKNLLTKTCLLITLAAPNTLFAKDIAAEDIVKNYASIVYTNYNDAYKDALKLQEAIKNFLANPSEKSQAEAKKAWLVSRDSYSQTEVFRFYEGPIDFVDSETGAEGPEGRLNAWPLNESYIDYVKGNSSAGIIQNEKISINKLTIQGKNQENDEADVATGYHAIEFLLWGQDLSLKTAGTRSFNDYIKGDPIKERRREYLKIVTELLVSDLKFLVDSWEPKKDNYAKEFIESGADQSLEKILTALATLSGFELSSERMATALDSGDQEDEHSCFSDNTHNDFIYNQQGVVNIFFGVYGNVSGASLYDLLKSKNHDLAEELEEQIIKTSKLIAKIPQPVDREVLASPEDSKGRKRMEQAIEALEKQADLFKEAGKTLGLKVQINS